MVNNFTYTDPLPVGTNNPMTDRPNMTVNNSSNNSLINVDHVSFNQNGGGIHRQVRMNAQPAPGVGDGSGVVYANTISGNTWPFWQNGIGSTFQILTGFASSSANGYLQLFPGFPIFQWGIVNGSHAGTFSDGDQGTVTFASANINFPSNCFNVQAACGWDGITKPSTTNAATFYINTISATSFSWLFRSSTSKVTQLLWFAIGA